MRIKTFMSGVVCGAVLATGVSVSAANAKVEAWLSDRFIINIDGNDMNVPPEYHVLNYDGHLYLPLRYLGEQLGADISYNPDRLRVNVRTPEPKVEIQYVEVEKPYDEQAEREKVMYEELPVKYKQKDVTVNVFGIRDGADYTYVYIDLKNDSPYPVYVDYRKCTIQVGDETFATPNSVTNAIWGSSVAEYTEMEDQVIEFKKIPEDTKKIILNIQVDILQNVKGELKAIPYTYTFPLDITNREVEGREYK